MTIAEVLNEYLKGNQSAIHTIQILSIPTSEKENSALLAIINLITRYELAEINIDTFRSILKMPII